MSLRLAGRNAKVAGLFAIMLFAAPLSASAQGTPPAIINPPDDVTIGINSTTGALSFTVLDAESPAESLVVTASSNDQTLVPDANIVPAGSGSGRSVTVTPAAGQTGSAVITITVTDPDGEFATEMFTVEVIKPLLFIDSYALMDEGHSGNTNLVFYVVLNDDIPIDATVTVNWATSKTGLPGACGFCSTAIAGKDYVASSGTLTFAPFETMKTISVPVMGDTVPEIDEWFFVALTDPVNADFDGDGTGLGLVFNDDFQSGFESQLTRWVQPVGVVGDFGQLFKTEATGWNAGASSAKSIISGNGGVEFTAGEADTVRIAGLSRGNTNTSFNDIDFGIELYFGGRVLVSENGVIRPIGYVTYVEGDRFGVAVENGQVVYRKNGVALYTSTVAPTYPLGVDTALYDELATLVDVVLTGRVARDVFFTNLVGVDASFNGVQKLDVDGWNAGAASTRSLVTGDGFMEFTATEEDTIRMVGLSSDNTDVDFGDIDFGIYLHSNATVYVVEGGITRGLFGSYFTGDRFQIAVEAGVVKYRRNGVTFYTSGVAPTYPLLVDAALFTEFATIDDVALSGAQGTDVEFVDAINVFTCGCGNSLTKDFSAPAGWNAGAISSQSIVQGDGFVEFETDDVPAFRIAGLSRAHGSSDFLNVDFGILLAENQTYYVFESGTFRAVFGLFVAGDRFRVSIEDGVVKYRRNGVLFYTSGETPVYPLLVSTSIYTPEGSIYDVVVWSDLGEEVTWTSVVGVAASAGELTKTAGIGWNAGAVSTRAIASGDGFVTFTTEEETTHKIIGLSNGNTDTDFADLDFGVLLAVNGTYYVFESGTSRGVFGTYLPGDRFEVAVDGGVVKYLKNRAIFYTSLVAPTYPLLVDTALFTPGATLTKVVLGCVTAACQ